MYKVVLCEDEQIFSQAQEKICRDILEKLNIEYRLSAYGSSADFLHVFLKQGERYDLVLLDIIMDGIDGMELARKIREMDTDAAIIFITSHREYAVEGYEVKALHYLLKPLDPSALQRLIENDYCTRFQAQYMIFEADAGKLRVRTNDIVCMETRGRRVEISLVDNKQAYYNGKLSELFTKLPHDTFVQCHKSYAVNIRNIRELGKQNAASVDGRTIPVSRAYSKEVQQAFLKKLRENK